MLNFLYVTQVWRWMQNKFCGPCKLKL